MIKPASLILDVGCGEDRNSLFLAKHGHQVEAFDISAAGIDKARALASKENSKVLFQVFDLASYSFLKNFDVILSHGVLHLPQKEVRDLFIEKMKIHTNPGGFHFTAVFTNRLPATPDNAPFTKSLFEVGELPQKYSGWKIIHHYEGCFEDTHPGGIHHQHSFERIIAQKA